MLRGLNVNLIQECRKLIFFKFGLRCSYNSFGVRAVYEEQDISKKVILFYASNYYQ